MDMVKFLDAFVGLAVDPTALQVSIHKDKSGALVLTDIRYDVSSIYSTSENLSCEKDTVSRGNQTTRNLIAQDLYYRTTQGFIYKGFTYQDLHASMQDAYGIVTFLSLAFIICAVLVSK